MKKFAVFLVVFTMMIFHHVSLFAQCSMCRATVENNVSNGEVGIGLGLNTGILYLLAMPYLLIGIIAFLWYKKQKSHGKTTGVESSIAG
jgi:hypothetical protein